ncbi:unnamed protein product, partial [Timema podura]|nr:unnamed protein product [Timema podura]
MNEHSAGNQTPVLPASVAAWSNLPLLQESRLPMTRRSRVSQMEDSLDSQLPVKNEFAEDFMYVEPDLGPFINVKEERAEV